MKILKSPVRQAYCSLWMLSGLKRWYSPLRRYWYWPPGSRLSSGSGRSGKARRWRSRTSAATSSMPIPSTREAVQVKYSSMNGWLRPMASNTCAP